MTPAELLEATKVEVDKRWKQGPGLWGNWGDGSCILGCLGFARFGEDFKQPTQNEGYDLLDSSPLVTQAISILARQVNPDEVAADPDDDMTLVYRQNDAWFGSKEDVHDFIDQALADLKAAVSA